MAKRRKHRSREIAQRAQGQPQRAAARPPLSELGATGLRLLGKQIAEEYNPDLKGPKLYDEYDRMLRGEGQCQAIELVVTLPIESLRWQVMPASEDQRDIEIAQDLSGNLFGGMTSTWEGFVSDCAMAALIGCMFFEKVWEIRDGQTWLRKLAPRHPRSIKEWDFDPEGGLQGIVQRVTLPGSSQSVDRTIPIAKLLRMTWREHGNPEGRGIMRGMRTHHFIKHTLYKLANIGLERFAVGTPVGVLPQGYTEQDKEIYLAILSALRTTGSGAIALPPGYERPSLLEGSSTGRFPAILQWAEYHDMMMARAALAMFIQLGATSAGSFALSDSQINMFLLALEAIARLIKAVVERYLIPEWVGYRYPGVDRFPNLWYSPIAHILQRAAIIEVLSKLGQSQLITYDQDLEDLLREMLGLPPRAEDSESPETIPQEDEGARRLWRPRGGARPSHSGRLFTAAARHRERRPRQDEHWRETQEHRAADRSQFEADMRSLLRRQHGALVKKLQPLVKAFREAPDLERGNHIRKMQQVEVPLTEPYQRLIADWIQKLYLTARDRAADAAGIEKPKSISNALRTWMQTKSQVIAQKHGEGLRAAVLLEVLESLRKDLPAKQLAWNLTQIARKRSGLDLTDDLVAAGQELTDLLNRELAEITVEAAAE